MALSDVISADGGELFQAAFAHSAVGMAVTDMEHRYLHVNVAYCRMSGYTEDQLRKTSTDAIVHPEDWVLGAMGSDRLLADEVSSFTYEKRYRRPDETVAWARATLSLVRDTEGEPRYFIAIVEDITERKNAEDAVHETNARLANILDKISDAFCTFDPEWRFTYVNAQAEILLQKPREELIGLCIWDIFPNASETLIYQEYHRAVREKTGVIFEQRHPPLGGWYEVHAYPHEDGLSAYFHNITARKLADATLREAHERTIEVLECMTDAFYSLDRNFIVTYVNRQAEKLWNLSREEMLGRNFAEIFSDLVGSNSYLIHQIHQRVLQSQMPETYEGVSVTTGRWVEATVIPSSDGVSVYFRDITERRAVEQNREELLQHERNIATQLQVALQPELPGMLPGLALVRHYESALPEASVGGDFYDAFVVDKGCTIIVVGDLSGKGLAAASQVATVRNMLRYALLTERTVADAVNSLNRTLSEHKLLTGFATLFVGCYDSGAQSLTYVNCAQEPALIRRAKNADIDRLEPTGTVLGAFGEALFAEKTVKLFRGDAVAIFTDGITESGPTRRDLLGIDGVIALLREPLKSQNGSEASELAEEISVRLVEAVNKRAQEGARDDICLVTAVVKQPC